MYKHNSYPCTINHVQDINLALIKFQMSINAYEDTIFPQIQFHAMIHILSFMRQVLYLSLIEESCRRILLVNHETIPICCSNIAIAIATLIMQRIAIPKLQLQKTSLE